MGKGVLETLRREWVLVVLAGLYATFRLAGFWDAVPRFYPDTGSYERIAGEPIFSGAFLADSRPPVLPLFYAVVGGDEARIWTQMAASIAAWLFLAGAVASCLRSALIRAVGFAAVLLFSLVPEIVLWDAVLLSESFALSFLAAFVACWLLILRTPEPSPWLYAGMLALAAAWAFTRDPHAYPVAAIGVAVAGWAWLAARDGGSRRLRLGVAAALVAIAAVSVVSANIRFARWAFPLQNVISLRIAIEPDQLADLERSGMPVTAELLAQMETFRETREGGLEHPPPFDNPEALEGETPFHRWLRTEGREDYSWFLLTNPGVLFGEAWQFRNAALLDPEVAQYASTSSPWDGGALSAAVHPRRATPAVLMALLAIVLAAFAWVRGGPRREWAVPAAMLVMAVPWAIFVYHGGALEPARHAVVPSTFLRLGSLLLLLFALDRLKSLHRAAF